MVDVNNKDFSQFCPSHIQSVSAQATDKILTEVGWKEVLNNENNVLLWYQVYKVGRKQAASMKFEMASKD